MMTEDINTLLESYLLSDQHSLKSKNKLIQDDFSIQLQQCFRNNASIKCVLQVTNLSEFERDLVVKFRKPPTKIITNAGEEYIISRIQIANKAKKFHKKGSGYQNFTKKILSKQKIEMQLQFDNIATTSPVIQLEISFGNNIGVIKFKNFLVENLGEKNE